MQELINMRLLCKYAIYLSVSSEAEHDPSCICHVFYVSVAMSSNKIGGAGNCLTRKKQDRVQFLGIKTTSDMDLKIIFASALSSETCA